MREICALLGIFMPFLLFSQTTIKGKITDANTGEPLIGVSIFIKNLEKGTVTDLNGDYFFKLKKEDGAFVKLAMTYTGYISQTIEVMNNAALVNRDITLVADILQLESVIVSANKKAQSSQAVPMSITTLSPQQLRRTGAQEFRDFASGIPNLSFDTQGAGLYGRFDNGISIRGIVGKNTTAMYLDETPLPENIDPRLVDVGQVEILKGPQGTLYGSRNMGGAIKIMTNQPNVSQLEGSADLNFAKVQEGDFDYGTQAILNIPITKKIAFRGVGYYDYKSGVFDRKINPNAHILNLESSINLPLIESSTFNIITDGCPACDLTNKENIDSKTNYGYQASLGFYPTKNIAIMAKTIAQKLNGDGYDFAEGQVGNFEQIRVSGVPEYFQDEWQHYSLLADIGLGIGRLISSTSYLKRNILEVDDDGESFSRGFEVYDGEEALDFFAGNISKDIDFEQFNQEIRFQSDLGGPIDFTLGAYYMTSKEHEDWLSSNTGAGSYISLLIYEDLEFAEEVEEEQYDFYDFGGVYDSKEIALFGEVYYSITSDLKATLGLRYFDATLGLNTFETGFIVDAEYFEVVGQVNESGVIPKFNLTQQLGKNKLAYLTVAKGYRLGDLNEIVPDVYCAEFLTDLPDGKHPRTFESDFVWNYEVGFKGTWANGKIVTNAAVFYNDWQNLQQTRTLECGYSFVSNVGAAHTTGLELEAKAKVFKNLEIGAGLGLLSSIIDKGGPNLEAVRGDRILFVPDVTANTNIQYTQKLNDNSSAYLRVDIQHVGERLNTFSPEELESAHLIFDPYTIVNTRLGIQFSRMEFSLWMNNVTNTAANFGDIFSVAVDIPGRPRYATNRPRTVGINARYYF